MSQGNGKALKLALALLEAAVMILPMLASSVRSMIEGLHVADEDKPLLDEVLARLPIESESQKAARDLDG